MHDRYYFPRGGIWIRTFKSGETMRMWTSYFDKYGLIVQKDGDSGDTAQRIGMYYFGKWCLGKLGYRVESNLHWMQLNEAMNYLEPMSDGRLIRSPTQWNDFNDFSRDQQTSIVISLGAYGLHERLKRIAYQHVKRLFRYQNGDIASPEHLGYYVRGLNLWALYPLLIVGDCFMLFNSLICLAKSALDPDNVGDNLNNIIALLQAHFALPTPISYLARLAYRLRPGEAQRALDWYFREESGGPPMDDLYRNIISEVF